MSSPKFLTSTCVEVLQSFFELLLGNSLFKYFATPNNWSIF